MSTITATKGEFVMERKKVSISSKRQITIPQKFFTMLGFADEAECIVRGNELVVRPTRTNSGGEFAEYILAELLAEGVEKDELLDKFKERQSKSRPAGEAMIAEADEVAHGSGKYYTYDDIFGDDAEDEDD